MIVVVIDRAQRNFVKLSTHTYSTYILLSRQTFLTCNYWNKEKYHQKSCVQVFSHGNTTMKIRKLWLNHSSSNLFSNSWKCLTIKWQTDSNCARALQLKKTLSKSPPLPKKMCLFIPETWNKSVYLINWKETGEINAILFSHLL